MKKHTVKNTTQNSDGDFQVVFHDGMSVVWPHEYMHDLTAGTIVYEHKHKNGQTVAFSWCKNLRFVVPQPMHFDESVVFLEKFRLLDRVSFNRAVVNAMHYRVGLGIIPDIESFAHNIVMFGLKTARAKMR